MQSMSNFIDGNFLWFYEASINYWFFFKKEPYTVWRSKEIVVFIVLLLGCEGKHFLLRRIIGGNEGINFLHCLLARLSGNKRWNNSVAILEK